MKQKVSRAQQARQRGRALLNGIEGDLKKVGGPVVHPEHYNACGERDTDGSVRFEPIKVIESWGLGYGFCMGNALKYILRAPHKGSERADLEKAIWYLERAASAEGLDVPLRADDACEAFEVAEAWGLEEELELAVEHIAMNNPRTAAAEVRRHLVVAGMADSICEAEDERILDELERDFEEAGRLTDSAVADAEEE